MIKYLFRKYIKDWKTYIIGVLNVAIGATSIPLILIWCLHELSFDKHYVDSESMYRVCSKVIFNGQNFSSCMSPPPLSQVLINELPDIESATRIWNWDNIAVSRIENGEIVKTFNEKKLVEADSNFLEFYDCKVLQGEKGKALNAPWKFVLTQKSALKYFSREEYKAGSIIGKSLMLSLFGFSRPCEITAIVEELPSNSHFHFDVLFSSLTDPDSRSDIWTNNTFYTYVKLRRGVLKNEVETKFPFLYRNYLDPQLRVKYNTSYEELKKNNDDWKYYLQPIEKIHLFSDFERELEDNGNFKTVIMLIGSCVFLFIIISINLINMNLFKIIENQKDFGVKRIFGSGSKVIWLEIFLENFLVAAVAAIVSFTVILKSTRYLSDFGSIIEMNTPIIYCSIVAITVLISVIAGLPAIILATGASPERLVRNALEVSYKRFNVRNMLITFQFFISLVLISFSLNVYKQNEYVQHFQPGFDKSNIIVVNDPSMRLGNQANTFIDELKKHASIQDVTLCYEFPGQHHYLDPVFISNKNETVNHLLKIFRADYNFISTFNLSLVSGRNFSREIDLGRTNRIIINKKASEELGFRNPDEAINRFVRMYDMRQNRDEYEIIGVLKNFNYESLHKPIHPLVYRLVETGFYFIVSTRPGQIAPSMKIIKQTWDKFAPGYPFEYYMLEDNIRKIYKNEIMANRLMYLFSILSIALSCIGLYGLSQEFLQKKRKDIVIRKINGASLKELLIWLLKYYNGLVLLSFIASIPVSKYLINKWLLNYIYKINYDYILTIWIGIAAIVLSSIILIVLSIKVFRSNIIATLREE